MRGKVLIVDDYLDQSTGEVSDQWLFDNDVTTSREVIETTPGREVTEWVEEGFVFWVGNINESGGPAGPLSSTDLAPPPAEGFG